MRFPLRFLLSTAASGAFVAVALASCGSRTALLGGTGEETEVGPDSGRDVVHPLPDGSPRDVVEEPTPCVPGRFTMDLAAAQLMFVIDRSGSMALTLSGQTANLEPSRWDVLDNALEKTIVPFDNQLAMGAKFFPEVNDQACLTESGVGIPPARGNAQQILNVFQTSGPSGGTPTADALGIAADYLAGRRGIARTMALATDGAPNCNDALNRFTCTCTSSDPNECKTAPDGALDCLDAARTISAIDDIFTNRKIPVYVVGIGGEESQAYIQTLNAMASAGGRPLTTGSTKYYNAQTPSDLADALSSIRDSVARCTFLTPSAPTNPDAISVQINGADVPRDPSHTNGWDWVDQAFGELAFFGGACTQASGGTAQVTGVVACTK